MRSLMFGLMSTALLLTGCSPGPPGGSKSSAPEQPSPSATPPKPARYVPVGHLIERSAKFVPEGGGYAIVLLKRGSPERSRQTCAAMSQSMSIRVGPADGLPIDWNGAKIYDRPVYWPVTVATPVDCAGMLQNYDFDRSAANLRLIPNARRLGQGPFVMVRRADGREAGLFDFSKLDGADFDQQFAAVVNYMSQQDGVWSADFYREANLRQMLKYYVHEQRRDAPIILASLVRELRAG
jgi:hypothetical protein